MKLIFDENLSPSLVDKLKDLFPGSTHVHYSNLGKAMDLDIWRFAKVSGFTIVSKDADYSELNTALGYPPKVVWIKRGNCSTSQIEELIRNDLEFIKQLESNPDLGIVSIL